ncbi:MAG: TRAP transporter substrate-binding protein [Leptolyngbya sp. SIO1D8]|nr:TRAP transporter substrate-binding protein [Leptolyngbya sp. SIO1D8]
MKRRQILTYAGLGTTGAAVLAACGSAGNDASTPTSETATVSSELPELRWRMATSWPQSLDTIFGGAQRVCDRVAALSGGKFIIEPYAAGEIVPGLEVLDAVQAGSVECGHTASYYYVGKNPALAFGTTVPFGLNAQQQNAWFYHGGGLDIMHKLYTDFGVINFPAGNTGTQMGGWFKREINTLSDLQGLKMRIPGLGGQVMNQLGVNVQVLPGGEIFLALDRGAIDAAEWVGPYDDEKLGLGDAADFYYYPGWWEPGATLETQVNLNAWSGLPTEYQDILATACYEANINMLAQYDAVNGAALQRLVDKGTQLVPYSDEILAAAEEAAFQLYADNANQDSTFKEVFDQWQAFRDALYGWNRVNELGFARFANRGE